MELVNSIKQNHFVHSVYIYGSRAKGLSNENSDVDIAVVISDSSQQRNVMKLIETWINNQESNILLHQMVIDIERFTHTEIGEQIKKGELIWMRN